MPVIETKFEAVLVISEVGHDGSSLGALGVSAETEQEKLPGVWRM